MLSRHCRGGAAGVSSTLYVGKFGGDFAVANCENVDATDVPGLPIAHLAIGPKDDGAIAANDYIFGVENGAGVAGEPSTPEVDDCRLALDAAAVGSRGSVFEDGVVGQPEREGVGVMAVKGIVEAVDDLTGAEGWRILRCGHGQWSLRGGSD